MGYVYAHRLRGNDVDLFQNDMISHYNDFTSFQNLLNKHNLSIKRNFVTVESNGLIIKLDCYYSNNSNRVSDSNVDQTSYDWHNNCLDEIKVFLRKYNLNITGANFVWGDYDNHVDFRIWTEYALADGSKPWEEDSMKETIKNWIGYRKMDTDYVDRNECLDFESRMPEDNWIGRTVKLPYLYKSAKKQNQTYKILGWENNAKYPLKLYCVDTDKKLSASFDWSMQFIG